MTLSSRDVTRCAAEHIALAPDERWAWDFWLADDGERFHLFYLTAPKSLGDEWLRHRNARIDHAVSVDLLSWTELGVALEHGGSSEPDATATWTGSVVPNPTGGWRMFSTGSRFLGEHPALANIETILYADSHSLTEWHKHPEFSLRADARWYETFADGIWREEAWRDPWVMPHPDGGWLMLVTARAATGPSDNRGVIGYARSSNLSDWEVQPPLSAPGAGFAHCEVPQLVQVNGRWVLVFSCATSDLSRSQRERGQVGGIFSVPVSAPGEPIDLRAALLLHDERLYSGRVVFNRAGEPQLLSFIAGSGDAFVGAIHAPLPLRLSATGHLELIAEQL